MTELSVNGADLTSSARSNTVLAPLPEEEYTLLTDDLEVKSMRLRDNLYEANARIDYVYFPLDALASLVVEAERGTLIEVGAVGREGMVGIPVYLGSPTSPTSAFCQVPGDMARMPAETLHKVLPHAPTLERQLSLFSNVLMSQLGQNAACNRAHSAEQRGARWLLLCADRIGREKFDITQVFLAQMLGVRRATVSEVAKALADAGVIRYQRGTITILDRNGLAERACVCYAQLRAQLQQIVQWPPR